MKLFFFLCFGIFSFSSAFASGCPQHYFKGLQPTLTNQKMTVKTTELCSSDYVVLHSGVVRIPLYAAEHLTRARLGQAKGLPRHDNFRPDPRLPAEDRSELRDYAKSGFDRGHLAPSGDMSSPDAQNESFLLSNIIPQEPSNNRLLHEAIESIVRVEAKKRGELFVVTGVIFPKSGLMYALKNRVYVPAQIYKAVYDPKKNEAAAYLEFNSPGSNYEIVSIQSLSALAGVDIFPGVSKEVKARAASLPVPKMRERRL